MKQSCHRIALFGKCNYHRISIGIQSSISQLFVWLAVWNLAYKLRLHWCVMSHMAYEPPLPHGNRKFMSKRCAGFRHFVEFNYSYPRRVAHCSDVVLSSFFQLPHLIREPPLVRKVKSPLANINSSSIQTMMSFIFVKIYGSEVTFAVLWMIRKRNLWIASQKSLTAEIFIWRVLISITSIKSLQFIWRSIQCANESKTRGREIRGYQANGLKMTVRTYVHKPMS